MITASPPDTAFRLGLDQNGIMWCDRTLQPGLSGCEKISSACSNCYAEVTAAGIVRKGRSEKSPPAMRATADFYAEGLTDDGRWTGRVSVHPERIGPAFAKLPRRASDRCRRVFVTSMSDLFHKDVPFDFLDRVFDEMEARPWIVFQVLTKRAERMAAYVTHRRARRSVEIGRLITAWPANVWSGVTVEDQRRADERIPWLLRVPAAVRFLSVEPMFGAIDLSGVQMHGFTVDALTGEWRDNTTEATGQDDLTLSWVIIGSESDGPRPGARETRPEWIESLVEQCDDASVPVFVKQAAIDGKLVALPMVNGRVRAEFPEVTCG